MKSIPWDVRRDGDVSVLRIEHNHKLPHMHNTDIIRHVVHPLIARGPT